MSDGSEFGRIFTEAAEDALSRSGVKPPAIDPVSELERVLELAAGARAALADEHEGDFRRAVLELHSRAATLLHLVATW